MSFFLYFFASLWNLSPPPAPPPFTPSKPFSGFWKNYCQGGNLGGFCMVWKYLYLTWYLITRLDRESQSEVTCPQHSAPIAPRLAVTSQKPCLCFLLWTSAGSSLCSSVLKFLGMSAQCSFQTTNPWPLTLRNYIFSLISSVFPVYRFFKLRDWSSDLIF